VLKVVWYFSQDEHLRKHKSHEKSTTFTADMQCHKSKVTQSQNKEAYGVDTSTHVIQTKHMKHVMTELEEIRGEYSKIN
jgi:hypothetical protein